MSCGDVTVSRQCADCVMNDPLHCVWACLLWKKHLSDIGVAHTHTHERAHTRVVFTVFPLYHCSSLHAGQVWKRTTEWGVFSHSSVTRGNVQDETNKCTQHLNASFWFRRLDSENGCLQQSTSIKELFQGIHMTFAHHFLFLLSIHYLFIILSHLHSYIFFIITIWKWTHLAGIFICTEHIIG